MAKRKRKNTVKIVWHADRKVIEQLDRLVDARKSDRGTVLSGLIWRAAQAAELGKETLRIRRSKAEDLGG